MGFRFSKRITLAPGVRLNIGKSGIGVSLGPRGLSLSAGPSGMYLNAGIPGTGLSWRERIDARPAAARREADDGHAGDVRFEVDADGELQLRDAHGQPLPAAAAGRIRAEQADSIAALLQQAAARINAELAACLGVHLQTPDPVAAPCGLAPFALPAPRPPQEAPPSLLDRILLRGELLEQRQAAAEARYREELHDWEQARVAHEQVREAVDKAFRLAARGFGAGMEAALDFVLSGIAWPKETQVSYLISYDQSAVAVDVDLPDEDATPRTGAEVRATRLALKQRSDAQARRDFVTLCHGVLFRVAGEVFATLPSVRQCIVSGYVQRPDPASGHLRDEYILSAVIDREPWSRLDFAHLERIDPAAALQSFGARVALDRSARFRPVPPFALEDIGQTA